MLAEQYGLKLVNLPIVPYISSDVLIRPVKYPWERQHYWQLRKQVFVHEQRLALDSETDEHDFVATPIVALAGLAGVDRDVVGGVRIFKTRGDQWFGGRLCVHPRYRKHKGIGMKLVNRAVCLAKQHGAAEFFAHVQPQNEPFFSKLHWHRIRDVKVAGHSHVLMEANLGAYPLVQMHP